MVAPSIQGISTSVDKTEITTSNLIIPVPTGVVSGEMLLAHLVMNGGASTPPTGWIEIVPNVTPPALTNPKVSAYYRIATAAEPASYTFTLSNTGAAGASMVRISGFDATTPFHVAAVAEGGATSATPTHAGITTTIADTLLVGGIGINSSSTVIFAAPTQLPEVIEFAGKKGEFGAGVQAVAGATGVLTWNLNGASREYVTWVAAVAPSASPPPSATTYKDKVLATGGLKGYWRLGDTDAVLTDASVGARNGTITNATSVAGLLGGDTNGALDFNPASSRATVPHAIDWSLAAGQIFSFEMILRASASQASVMQIFVHKGSDVNGTQGWGLYQNANAGTIVLERVLNSVSNYADSTTPLPINTTTHVVLTFDGTNNRYYTNGVLRRTWNSGATVSLVDISTTLAIGAFASGSGRFLGVMDEVALYHSVLDLATVQGHYNASLSLPQITRPSSDVSIGTWTDNTGGTAALYATLDEVIRADADFIQSGKSPATSTVYLFTLGALSTPVSDLNHHMEYTLGKDEAGGDALQATVEVLQGATVIASEIRTVPDVFTLYDLILTEAQAATITNYGDLRGRITVIKV